jgi:hypothetical protein
MNLYGPGLDRVAKRSNWINDINELDVIINPVSGVTPIQP